MRGNQRGYDLKLMISRTISAENIRVYEKKSHFSVDNLRNEVYTLDVPCKVI